MPGQQHHTQALTIFPKEFQPIERPVLEPGSQYEEGASNKVLYIEHNPLPLMLPAPFRVDRRGVGNTWLRLSLWEKKERRCWFHILVLVFATYICFNGN